MTDHTLRPFPAKGSALGVGLAVWLLASGCSPSRAQQSQACQASKDPRSPECTAYWGSGRDNPAGALTAKDLQAPARAGGYGPGYVPADPVQGYPSPDVQRRRRSDR